MVWAHAACEGLPLSAEIWMLFPTDAPVHIQDSELVLDRENQMNSNDLTHKDQDLPWEDLIRQT